MAKDDDEGGTLGERMIRIEERMKVVQRDLASIRSVLKLIGASFAGAVILAAANFIIGGGLA